MILQSLMQSQAHVVKQSLTGCSKIMTADAVQNIYCRRDRAVQLNFAVHQGAENSALGCLFVKSLAVRRLAA